MNNSQDKKLDAHKRNKSILVIDDDLQICEILREILEPIYKEVITCSSPADAKKLIEARSFSLVISDVNMPEIPGAELMKHLRASGRLEPIVFLTGYITTELLLKALRLGASDVIQKPFNVDDILGCLDRVFEIDKRRFGVISATLEANSDEDRVQKQRKMLGLLHAHSAQRIKN